MDTVDVSTHEIASNTSKAFSDKVTVEVVLSIWHNIGNMVKAQLMQRKAVRLTGFGLFTFSQRGEPIFQIANEFARQFKVVQRGQVTPDNIATSPLNFAQVASELQIQRETTEKVYNKFLNVMGRSIFEGRNVLVSLNKVAEVYIGNGEVKYNFLPNFLSTFEITVLNNSTVKKGGIEHLRTVAKKTSTLISTTKKMESEIQRERNYSKTHSQTGLQIGSEGANTPTRMVRGRSHSNMRGGTNPITGDFDQYYGEKSNGYDDDLNTFNNKSNRRPASAGRSRPGSASSLRTDSIISTSSAGNYNQRPSSGTNNAHAVANQRTRGLVNSRQEHRAAGIRRDEDVIDARRIAAQALDVGDIVQRVRQKIAERGGTDGIRSIAKLLSIMDDNGDKKLSKDELKFGLRDYGINLSPTELEQVFIYFDRDRNGFIDITEFLIGLKGDLNPRRKQVVRMAFDRLDTDKSGVVSTEEIMAVYDFTWHPEVRAGRMTVKEASKDFMRVWDGNSNGEVTIEEFEEYYKEVSASIDEDDYFELMIRNAWRISGGSGAAANTANRRVLVTNRDGSQSVVELQDDLGVKRGKGNRADVDDIRQRLARQGIDGGNIDLYGEYSDVKPGKAGARRPTPTRSNRPSNPTSNNRKAPVREAWMDGPARGDENVNYSDFADNQPTRGNDYVVSGNNRGNSINHGKDPLEVLHSILYTPPVTLEMLCLKLQVSAANATPRIAQGAFIRRLSTLDPTLDRHELQDIWKTIDPKNLGSVEVTDLHSLLSNRYGKDKTANKNTGIIDRVLKKILERCGENAGLKGLQRTLMVMDNSGDKKLTKEELKYGLQDYGLELNIRELEEIFHYFDRDRNGIVDIDEFLLGVKGDLSPRRQQMIKMAFNVLDRDRSGIITTEEMIERYDFTQHPDVVAGRKTIKEAMREFMRVFDRHDNNGEITYEEFEDYYKGVSASIDGDDYFELMIRNAWRISGGSGAAANTANRRVLVTNRDGSQSVVELQDDLGVKKGKGNRADVDDIRQRLARQGIDGGNIDLYGDLDTRDKAKTMQAPSKFQQRGQQQQPVANHRKPSQQQLNKTAPAKSSNPGANQFERNVAAMKLAAAYRGRLGRKQAEQERRKVEAGTRQREEEYEEMNRPRPRDVLRPKGRSYIGF